MMPPIASRRSFMTLLDQRSAVSADAELRPMAGRRSGLAHIAEIVRYRELLAMLVRKELTVRYKNSVLGFTWSMIQPLFLLVVYTAVFAILGAGFASFAIWVLCGLIVWNLISSSLITSTVSITSNASLVGKVRFPRAILPLASVGGALVHFCFQIIAFAAVLAVTRHPVDWGYIILLPVALATCLVVCAACALVLAPSNVYARDTQHLLELLVLGWFWATPILYTFGRSGEWLATHGISDSVQFINPAHADRHHVPAGALRRRPRLGSVAAPPPRPAVVSRAARRHRRRVVGHRVRRPSSCSTGPT